jgi:hypothetical protein
MGRKAGSNAKKPGRLKNAAKAVMRFVTRGRGEEQTPTTRVSQQQAQPPVEQAARRTTTRQTDIPLDVLSQTYNPPLTSSKASFRSDGADHHSDQEFAYGASDSRWNDEDRMTNKSGDPRIGTHGRTYEPAETRDESRD